MQAKERCFRIPAKYADFSSSLFGSALTFWLAEPPADIVQLSEASEDKQIVQKKISLAADDVSLMSTLKDYYKVTHDYEMVSLVIAHAVNNNRYFAA